MKFAISQPRKLFSRSTLGADLKAGLVLGIEGVPDNLSSGVLAGINPVSAVYASIFGIAGAALFASSTLMPVQATGALSIIVRDVNLSDYENPAGALATLTLFTGVIMIVAGVLRLGRAIRFVSRSVVTGFIAAVGVNIVLGQFADLTAYPASGNRIVAAIRTLIHPTEWHWQPLLVGVTTAVAIVVLRRTRLRGMGYVAAVVIAWVLAYWLNRNGGDVALVRDIAEVPTGLPLPVMPDLSESLNLVVPAFSLAFVGLVQGAGVASSVENPDGTPTNASQDFIAQGAGNIAAGFFRGMPVGGSASGTVLMQTAGARSRGALFFTSIIMGVLIVGLAPVVAQVPLAGLAGMLLVIGTDTIPVDTVRRVLATGRVPTVVMVMTFAMTMLIPLQYAVLVGVGCAVVLFTIGESSRLELKQIVRDADGTLREVALPATLGAREVLLIQPYGTVFFASADLLIEQLPTVTAATRRSVVILRLRGEQSPSVTLVERLARYARQLADADCRLIVVTTSEELIEDLSIGQAIDESAGRSIYRGDDRIGAAAARAWADAQEWVGARP